MGSSAHTRQSVSLTLEECVHGVAYTSVYTASRKHASAGLTGDETARGAGAVASWKLWLGACGGGGGASGRAGAGGRGAGGFAA